MIRAVTVPDLRLAIPAAVLWLGCGIGIGVGGAGIRIVAVVSAVAAAVVCGVAIRIRRRPVLPAIAASLALSAAVLALGSTAIAVQGPSRRPPPVVAAARGSHAVTVDVRVDGDVVRGRVDATIVRIRVAERVWRAAVPAVVVRGVAPGTPLGATVRVSGTLRMLDRAEERPVQVFVRGDAVTVARPPPLLAALGGLRAGLARTADRLPGDGGDLLPGLAIGDTSRVGDTLRADLRTASLTHLTAVSGANCAVVVGLVLVVLAGAGAPRMLRIGGAGTVLALFVVLVTPQPSVVRAAAMAALVLLAMALGRPIRGVPVLALAVIVLLVGDPWLARSYGFTLSVLATGGLLLLAPLLARRLARVLPRPLALALSVPLAAQVACQPVLLLLTPALPLWGVPANLLAEPAAPAATVLGLVACLLLPVAPPLGHAVAALAWVPSAWIAGVAHVAAALPGASIPWLPGIAGGAVVAALTGAALLALLPTPPVLRVVAGAVLAATLVGLAGAAVGSGIAATAGRPGDWQYAECDIGQGDSTVIRSRGAVAVVDTGPKPERMRHCLDQLGISRIDLLVLTHYDLDHVGGTDAVVGRVDRALIGPSSGADDDRIAARLRAGGAHVEQTSAGTAGRLGQLDWTVLWPPPRGVEPGNPASVTLSVTPAPGCAGGCLTGLLLGDLGAESQQRMAGAAHPGRYDLVKVAHHGSADQWPELYRRIRATVGLIGVGADNTYGHPTPFALGMLADAGTRAFRTDRDGLVLVADDGDHRARVWTERTEAVGASSVHPLFTQRTYRPDDLRPRGVDSVEGWSAWTPCSWWPSSSSWLSRSTSPTASTTPPMRWRPRSPPGLCAPGLRSRSPPC